MPPKKPFTPKDTKDLVSSLGKLLSVRGFEPYIQHIRFPYYKNFVDNCRIDFTFPITILTGQNGTNKSSVLKALYGCCFNKSLAELWFSSETDYVPDRDKKSLRYIYGYFDLELGIDVEVLQNRRKREGEPDYWETSRPSKQDGMQHSRKDVREITKGDRERWEKIGKSCKVIDFRSEISAYDRFFYHSSLKNGDRFDDKRDFIRDRSKYIKDAIDTDSSQSIRWGRNEWKIEVTDLSIEEIREINIILDRDYSSIRILDHNLFRFSGSSVSITSSDDVSYTEAFSGSGEYAVIKLVHGISALPEKSLLLMDEPEVSLHPRAQEKLINFICRISLSRKIQVVISTHSPYIVKDLPSSAIKVFFRIEDKVDVVQDCSPNEAFFYIAKDMTHKTKVYCEDRLGKYLLEFIMSKKKPKSFIDQFQINYLPGGAEQIISNQIVPASQRGDEIHFILDGDKKKVEQFSNPDSIPASENQNLDNIIESEVGFSINFSLNSNDPRGRIETKRLFLQYLRNYLVYFPFLTPEEFILTNSSDEACIKWRASATLSLNSKDAMREIAKLKLERENVDEIDGEEIFIIQKMLIAKINMDLPEINEVISKLERMLS